LVASKRKREKGGGGTCLKAIAAKLVKRSSIFSGRAGEEREKRDGEWTMTKPFSSLSRYSLKKEERKKRVSPPLVCIRRQSQKKKGKALGDFRATEAGKKGREKKETASIPLSGKEFGPTYVGRKEKKKSETPLFAIAWRQNGGRRKEKGKTICPSTARNCRSAPRRGKNRARILIFSFLELTEGKKGGGRKDRHLRRIIPRARALKEGGEKRDCLISLLEKEKKEEPRLGKGNRSGSGK